MGPNRAILSRATFHPIRWKANTPFESLLAPSIFFSQTAGCGEEQFIRTFLTKGLRLGPVYIEVGDPR